MGSEIFEKARAGSGAGYLRLAGLEKQFPVRTFFSTREGGASSGAYASLNMGFPPETTGQMWRKTEEASSILSEKTDTARRCRIRCTERMSPVCGFRRDPRGKQEKKEA